MFNFKSILTWCLVIVSTAVSQPALAQSGFGTGSNIAQIYALGPNGQYLPLEVDSTGQLKVDASVTSNVSLDRASLAVVDDDGDTWNVQPNGHGEVALVGESVNLATDTEIQNLQSLVDEIEPLLSDTGVVQVDGDNETPDFQLSPTNGISSITVQPAQSQTVVFGSAASRVSFNSSGATEFRYNINSSTADTTAMIVYEGMEIEKGNGSYNQITFYNLSTNSNPVTVSVMPEF